jgi:transcriptional regulator with XRE-family HTH domain
MQTDTQNTNQSKKATPTEFFRDFLKGQREELGLKSADLSEKIGRSETYIHQFEKGAIQDLTLDVFCEIAIKTGIMPWDFLQAFYELLWSSQQVSQVEDQ